jgi:hypothetical protein
VKVLGIIAVIVALPGVTDDDGELPPGDPPGPDPIHLLGRDGIEADDDGCYIITGRGQRRQWIGEPRHRRGRRCRRAISATTAASRALNQASSRSRPRSRFLSSAAFAPRSDVSFDTQMRALRLSKSWALEMTEPYRRRPDWYAIQSDFWRQLADEAAGDAEIKLAARLKVPALALALAARKAWGESLTARRDRRFAEEWTSMYEPPVPALTDVSPRWVQAVRGVITRELVAELEPLLEDVPKKRRGKR